MRQRFLAFVFLGLVIIAVGEWHLRTGQEGLIGRVNQFWLEFCMGNASDRIADPAVTVVRITDEYEPITIGEDGSAAHTDLSRLDYATILGFVGRQNPKNVAFLPTPTFDESRVLNQTDVVPLKDAALQLPKIHTATVVSDDGEDAKDAMPMNYPTLQVEGDTASLLPFTRTVRYPEPQILANGTPLFKSIQSARGLVGGNEVRIPLVARYKDSVIPSLVLATAAHHFGVPLEEVTVVLQGAGSEIRLGEARVIPIHADGTLTMPRHAGIGPEATSLRINEQGQREEVFHFTSLKVEELAYTGSDGDAVAQRILADLQGKFRSFQHNAVLIGFDRNADRLVKMPDGETISETTLMARALGVIQSGRFIHWWSGEARLLAVVVTFVFAFFLFRQQRPRFLLVAALAPLLFFSICVLVFRSTLSWTPPFVFFGLFALLLALGLLPGKSRPTDSGGTPAE